MTTQAIVQTIAAIAVTGALIWWLYRLSAGSDRTAPRRRGKDGGVLAAPAATANSGKSESDEGGGGDGGGSDGGGSGGDGGGGGGGD